MARANVIQTNFTSGEVSPLMYGRVDVNKYFNGVKKLVNFIVRPQGGIQRRSGTRFVHEVKDSTKHTVLAKFIFSETQAFVLEFGETYVRFYQDGGRIESPPGTAVEVATPYLATELDQLYITQSADVLYIAHPFYQTRKLSRTSNTSWTLSLYDPFDGPYLDTDSSGALLTIATTSDTANLVSNTTGSNSLIATGGTPFAAGDVGKYVDYQTTLAFSGALVWTLGLVTANTSSTIDVITVVDQASIFSHADTGTFSGGTITNANFTYPSSAVGKFIRLAGTGVWYTITAMTGSPGGSTIPTRFKTCTATALTVVSYNHSTITLTLQNGFAVGDVSKYIEYRDQDQWKFAKITAFVSPSQVTVQVIDNIFYPNTAAKITSGGTNITSDLAGVFTPKPGKGMFVRLTADSGGAGNWYKLNTYSSSTSWSSASAQTMRDYTYPTVSIAVRGRVILATVTASTDLFIQSDVGRWIRMNFAAQVRSMKILTVISSTTVLVQIFADNSANLVGVPPDEDNADNFYNNGLADVFKLGAWSNTTGWPSVVSFHEQRLIFSKTTTQPQTVWGTRSGDYENQAPTEVDLTVVADNAVNYTIASNRINPVMWMETGPVLLVGTLGSEYQMKATLLNAPITPTNIDIKEQTRHGSISTARPYRIGSAVLFLQRGGNKLREMTYDFNIDAYVSKDVSILSEHILRNGQGGFVAAYQQEPTGCLWIVMNDGNLAAVTYERDQDVIAWHRHIIGGSGFVESITSVPSSTGGQDYIYLVVRRTINGSTKRYIEYIESEYSAARGNSIRDAFFVDCGLSYSGVSAGTISGLDHLEGCTVQVFSEGAFLGTRVVSSGAITVPPTTKASVGFACPAVVGTLDPEGGSQAGTSQGKKKRIAAMDFRLLESMPFKVGPTETKGLFQIIQDDWKELKSGDVRVTLDQPYDSGAKISIVQDVPYPLTILALMPQMNTNE